MSEEFGPNFITLTDEDGNDIEPEYVDALEDNGQTYMAFFPTVDDETDEAAAEDFGLVILKSVMENGEELLTTTRQKASHMAAMVLSGGMFIVWVALPPA